MTLFCTPSRNSEFCFRRYGYLTLLTSADGESEHGLVIDGGDNIMQAVIEFDVRFSRFDTIPASDRQTYRHLSHSP